MALIVSVGLADRAAENVVESRLSVPPVPKVMPMELAVVYVEFPVMFPSSVSLWSFLSRQGSGCP